MLESFLKALGLAMIFLSCVIAMAAEPTSELLEKIWYPGLLSAIVIGLILMQTGSLKYRRPRRPLWPFN